MPELPEVETIARALNRGDVNSPPLPGKIVRSAQVLWERTLALPGVTEFVKRLPRQIVKSVGRRGKFVRIELSTDILLIHLRMSGDLVVEPAEDAPGKHHRLIITFKDKTRLAFVDARKFGRAWLTQNPEEVLGQLGPEPLSDDFTPELLYESLQRKHRQIKPLLLDQSFIAGIGNIYADEALHLARLHPCRSSQSLSAAEAERLWKAIRDVLEEGIRRNGASIDWVYRGGDFQNHFLVYQRTGEPCSTCGTPIERIVVGQRSTHYCPACQPATH